jgi:hypothetical protein
MLCHGFCTHVTSIFCNSSFVAAEREEWGLKEWWKGNIKICMYARESRVSWYGAYMFAIHIHSSCAATQSSCFQCSLHVLIVGVFDEFRVNSNNIEMTTECYWDVHVTHRPLLAADTLGMMEENKQMQTECDYCWLCLTKHQSSLTETRVRRWGYAIKLINLPNWNACVLKTTLLLVAPALLRI